MTSGLRRLRDGTLGWVRRNAGYLGSPLARADLPAVPRAKAILQLARLYRSWAGVCPDEPGLAEVGAIIARAWRHPELPDALAADPRYARQYSLMYCALSPVPDGPRREVLAGLAADGYLSRPRRSPYLRLEIAHYADMAQAGHAMGSYRELYAASSLARRAAGLPAAGPPVTGTPVTGTLPVTGTPVSDDEACVIAHTIFYLSDYGLRAPDLDRAEAERARHVVAELTWHYVQRDEWDNIAKFVLAQFCLGLDPADTPSGAAGLAMLAGIQEASGAIPCAALRLMPGPAATPTQRFRKAYQTTLMTALMSLMASSARR